MGKFQDILDQGQAEKETEEEKSQSNFKPVLLKDISENEGKYSWIWENVIAKGQSTLMTALYKTGKSTFIRCMIRAIHDEEEFLGFPTKRCKILVISEEDRTQWKNKSYDFGLDDEELALWIGRPPFYGRSSRKSWENFIFNDLFNFCIENKIELVIFDTISHFWPVDKENDPGETGAALGVLDKLKDAGIAPFVIQQSNKAGGEFAKAVRGSSEIGGWPDEIIVFARPQGDNQQTRRREITFFGRLFELGEPLFIKLNYDNIYTVEGSKYQVSKAARLEVLTTIFKSQDKPLMIKEVRDLWDDGLYGAKPSDETIRRYICGELEMGTLRLVDEITIVKRKVPRYGLGEKTYLEQLTTTSNPYIEGSVVSSVNNSTHHSGEGKEKVLVSKANDTINPDFDEETNHVMEYFKTGYSLPEK